MNSQVAKLYIYYDIDSVTTYYNVSLTVKTYSDAPTIDPCPNLLY